MLISLLNFPKTHEVVSKKLLPMLFLKFSRSMMTFDEILLTVFLVLFADYSLVEEQYLSRTKAFFNWRCFYQGQLFGGSLCITSSLSEVSWNPTCWIRVWRLHVPCTLAKKVNLDCYFWDCYASVSPGMRYVETYTKHIECAYEGYMCHEPLLKDSDLQHVFKTECHKIKVRQHYLEKNSKSFLILCFTIKLTPNGVPYKAISNQYCSISWNHSVLKLFQEPALCCLWFSPEAHVF